MIPEDKIICLIKKYRAESERNWIRYGGWTRSKVSRSLAIICDDHADDLEELLKSMKGGENHENKK